MQDIPAHRAPAVVPTPADQFATNDKGALVNVSERERQEAAKAAAASAKAAPAAVNAPTPAAPVKKEG